MKKSILSAVLLSGLVLSVGAPSAFAAKTKTTDEATSRVEVNLTKDDGHEDNEGPYRGHLAIVKKPTVYKFKGSASSNEFTLINENLAKNTMFMAIHDDRRVDPNLPSDDSNLPDPGEWELTGQMSDLKNKDDDKLQGALLDIATDSSQIFKFAPNEENPANDADLTFPALPTGNAAIAAPDFELTKNIKMTAGATGPTMVMERTKVTDNTLRGVYTNLGDAKLTIPANQGNNVSHYEGTITWTLTGK